MATRSTRATSRKSSSGGLMRSSSSDFLLPATIPKQRGKRSVISSNRTHDIVPTDDDETDNNFDEDEEEGEQLQISVGLVTSASKSDLTNSTQKSRSHSNTPQSRKATPSKSSLEGGVDGGELTTATVVDNNSTQSEVVSTELVAESSLATAVTKSELFSSVNVHQMTPELRVQCEETANEYITNCKRFHIAIDPSVVIALQTGWHVLQPTRRFTEGSMLPLMGILEENALITKLNLANVTMIDSRFRAAGNGNSNCRILSHVLQHNQWIKELDLSNNGIDDDGIKEICDGIANNHGLEKLNLSSNHFGEEGARFLRDAIVRNTSIRELDLSRNALGFQSISSVLCVCNPRKISVATSGNYVFEEILNSVSHGLAFLGSVIGANILISEAADQYTNYHFWACVLYSFALMFLFLSSCLFHSFFMLPTTSKIFQILDHIGIYMVIAGSYTPFLLIAMHHHKSAQVLLTGEWIAAILGSIVSACSDLNNPLTNVIEVTVFVSMGFGGAIVWPTMLGEICREALVLIIVGGAFYLVGILFYIGGEFKPVFHAVWHVFVILAAAAHWFCIYFYVVQVNINDSPGKAAVTDLVDSMSAAASVTASFVNAAKDRIHHQ